MSKATEQLLTTFQAAELIGCSRERISQLLNSGEMQGTRIGRFWVIPQAEALRIKRLKPTTGRPRGSKNKR